MSTYTQFYTNGSYRSPSELTPFKFRDSVIIADITQLIHNSEHQTYETYKNLTTIFLGFMVQKYDVQFDTDHAHYNYIKKFMETFVNYKNDIISDITSSKLRDDPIFGQIKTDDEYALFIHQINIFINHTNSLLIDDSNGSDNMTIDENNHESVIKKQKV